MKKLISNNKLALYVIFFTFALWIIFLPVLPDNITMQYKLNGDSSWSTSKFFLGPIFMAIMLMTYIISIYKEKKNEALDLYIFNRLLITELLLMTVGILLVLAEMKYIFNIPMMCLIIVGIFLILIGNILPKLPPSSYGIRNKWTKNSQDVWNMTHRKVSRFYIILGFICIFISFTLEIKTYMLFIIMISLIILPYIISYLEYKKNN
ncbi:SdpI family protein [Macrococcoides canis]|uniref:SdpI family protein n=1 Tax=Macrococcoides canis TaxID=1855823 RepID=UPI0010FBF293|nr:SdpI family protein [Macrococcus canis]QCT75662.1 SdpI family protein [Macrococcus canis]